MSRVIDSLEQRQLRSDLPPFKAGDTVRVHFQVIEGQRRRAGSTHLASSTLCQRCPRFRTQK